VSGQSFIRISRGAQADSNNVPFTLIKVPTSLSVVWSCTDSLKLLWNGVTGAIGYEISKLGAMYMDSIGTTSATSYIVHGLNPADTNWFSVKAIAPNNGKGRRAFAMRKLPGNIGSCIVGVNNMTDESEPGFMVYPNPSSGLIHVEIKNINSEKVFFTVLDMNGREVMSKRYTAVYSDLNDEIDLSGKAKGFYLLNIATDKSVYHLKLMLL
jgi:hypothetical protein